MRELRTMGKWAMGRHQRRYAVAVYDGCRRRGNHRLVGDEERVMKAEIKGKELVITLDLQTPATLPWLDATTRVFPLADGAGV